MRRLLDSTATKVAAVVVAVAAALVIGVQLFRGADTKTAVAYFPVAIHLYPGSEVDVLGVRIGTVTSVTPEPGRVRVEIAYDAGRRIPASAQAVVGEPTLVADRVVELTPPYAGGPVLPDGATIPLARTHVPLELDQLAANLRDLADALGPSGANRQGALTRAVAVGAANLRGEGAATNTAITRIGRLMRTLGDNRGHLFDAVRQLESFTTSLASHDAETRAFTSDLSDVATLLAGDSGAFRSALADLGVALDEVTRFVHAHRGALARDVRGLASVARILDRERILLGRTVDIGAVGISNYPHMYTPSARTYNARFDNVMTDNPALFLCQLFGSVGGSPQKCLSMLQPLSKVRLPSGSAP